MSKFRAPDEAARYYHERIEKYSALTAFSSIQGESETLSAQVKMPLRENRDVLLHICKQFPDEGDRDLLLSTSLKQTTNVMDAYLQQMHMPRSFLEKMSDLSLRYESRLLIPSDLESTQFIANKVRSDVEQILRKYRSAGILVPDDVTRSREDIQNIAHVLAGKTLLDHPSALEDPEALEDASILHTGILEGEKVEAMVAPHLHAAEELWEQFSSDVHLTPEEFRESFISVAREQIFHFHSLYLRHRIFRTLIMSVGDVSDAEGGSAT